MSRIENVLRRVARDLAGLGRHFSVVGGLAVSARAEPRFTRDVDLAVAVSGDPDAEALLQALMQRGYRAVMVTEQEEVGRLATARLVPPSEDPEGVVVDLLFASSGVESEVVSGAARLELLPGLHLPVASRPHLLALKVLARDDRVRPQDSVDLRALAHGLTEAELTEARHVLELIRIRGYARGKDLGRELEQVLASD